MWERGGDGWYEETIVSELLFWIRAENVEYRAATVLTSDCMLHSIILMH